MASMACGGLRCARRPTPTPAPASASASTPTARHGPVQLPAHLPTALRRDAAAPSVASVRRASSQHRRCFVSPGSTCLPTAALHPSVAPRAAPATTATAATTAASIWTPCWTNSSATRRSPLGCFLDAAYAARIPRVAGGR
ncbi:hypothetical protein BS50DRAFT_572121 [Corynespora cassiicola Philippines]|uniref:Uncharacterized protein n=1 Tax=Corynespora cassiicola Philippines TaxID=1448308 RepID=A0A2T2NU26_CORCC|nr:hypothetical protein BS50DRAFT_572121 [Corynespora cassiicola Philippines]